MQFALWRAEVTLDYPHSVVGGELHFLPESVIVFCQGFKQSPDRAAWCCMHMVIQSHFTESLLVTFKQNAAPFSLCIPRKSTGPACRSESLLCNLLLVTTQYQTDTRVVKKSLSPTHTHKQTKGGILHIHGNQSINSTQFNQTSFSMNEPLHHFILWISRFSICLWAPLLNSMVLIFNQPYFTLSTPGKKVFSHRPYLEATNREKNIWLCAVPLPLHISSDTV